MRVPSFADFWRRYPLHRAKGPAEKAWDRLSARDKWAAYGAVGAYREACERTHVAFKYAAGWLNDRRWEDEDVSASPSPASVQGRDVFEDMDIW